MLSLAKIGRGREDYHLRAVGADATEYYSERGEVAGVWLGGGAEALGLQGELEGEAMLAVLAGYTPDAVKDGDRWSGRRLVKPPQSGERMPGIDACFAAPKGVSLLYAFGDRVDVNGRWLADVVVSAHNEAVREALGYLEASAARGRRGRDGMAQVESSGFVAAAFRHRTSRAMDPHLHTHVVIANMCQGTDGQWGALDARLLYAHAKTAGYLYEAHLRFRLSQELGVEWKEVVNGIADVAAVPEGMVGLFSKRSKELRGALDEVTRRINEERARLGLALVDARSQEALDIAAHQTRAAKLYGVGIADLREGWRREGRAAGLDPDAVAGAFNPDGPVPSLEPDPALHARVGRELTEPASTFGHRDAVRAMAADARAGLPVSEVLRRAKALLASDEVLPIVGATRDQDVIRREDGSVAPVPTGERRWSTREMLGVEESLVANAMRRQAEGAAVVPEDLLRQSLATSVARLPTLGDDQLAMVVRLASSGAVVECVEAAPGTGKTTALGVYVAALRRAGIPVVGCAPSARARDELRLGARIDACFTMHRLLWELGRSSLEAGSVVILDEASMAGSRILRRLLDAMDASRAKVVLVGDTKQLSSVDAGGGFRGLVARLGAHGLRENRRQVEAWEREALADLREGRVRRAMTAYAGHGRLRLGAHAGLLERMVADWWAARPQGEAVMQALNWRDVDALNERARERLVEAGLVGRDGLEVRGQTIGVGDQVIVLRNNRQLEVINGTQGTITAMDRQRQELVIRTVEVEPREIVLPSSFWNARGRRRLALAYCRTIHKAQSATYRGQSYTLAGDDTIHLEAVHVALSRGTQANHLYYSGEPPPDEEQRPIAEAAEEPHLARLVWAAGRSRAQVMALDYLHGLAGGPDGRAGGLEWAEAPMTEKQVAILARAGTLPARGDLTWVQASLLIDEAVGTPRAAAARRWLRENGASVEEAQDIIEWAERDLDGPGKVSGSGVLAVRLDRLDEAEHDGRRPTGGEREEQDTLRGWHAHAMRSAWERRRQEAAAPPLAVPATTRPTPRIGQ